MIQPIFIRRLYSCTARARGCDATLPRDPHARTPREEIRKWLAMHMGGTLTTQAQHAARTPACSCPAYPSCQPREWPRLSPLPQSSASLQPRSSEISNKSAGKPRRGIPQPPGKPTPVQGGSSGARGSHWKARVPGKSAFSFPPPCHDRPKQELLQGHCSRSSVGGPQQHPGLQTSCTAQS